MRVELDEDGEAIDGFTRQTMKRSKKSVTKLGHCTNWGFYNAMYYRYASRIHKFLLCNVGKNIDDVYAKYCNMISSETPKNRVWLRDRWDSYVVFSAIEVDGNICSPDASYGHYYTLSTGEYFVRNGSKTLEVAVRKPMVKVEQKCVRVEVYDSLYFTLEPVIYYRKITCGVHEEVIEWCWFKTSVSRYNDVVTSFEIKYDALGVSYREYHCKPYIRVEKRKVTASKKELLIHNLTKEK